MEKETVISIPLTDMLIDELHDLFKRHGWKQGADYWEGRNCSDQIAMFKKAQIVFRSEKLAQEAKWLMMP